MAEAITDEHVIRVLLPFVRANRPVLDALREADPFGLRKRVSAGSAEDRLPRTAKDRLLNFVSAVHVPGTPAWAAMSPDQRCDWWVNRVGRFLALVAAVPGFGGFLADRLPVQDALGAAGQGLLLCAIAGEYGVRDEHERVRMLAHVLFQRDLSAQLLARSAKREVESEQKAAELTAELDMPDGKPTLKAVAGTMWRLGRALWELGDELGKRPQGRIYHKVAGWLPVVGVAGDYFGERHALRSASRAGRAWAVANRAATG
jgi:hypothetical protein